MDSVFLSLLNISITASWLVLAVLALRLLLRKAPKWVFCLLWGMVAVRLVCPVSIESIFSLIPSTQTVDTTRYLAKPYIDTGISAVDTPVNEYIGSTYFEGVTVPVNHFANLMDILSIIWLVGMLLMLGYCAVSYLGLRRRVATATILEGNIRQCETVDSPFVLGIFKPTIYLPYQIQPEDIAHVIAHEKAHIRRKDHWWKPIGFIIFSVYWFNPVIWLAYIFLCRDIEAACDEKVIREMETEERRAYSAALLNCSVHRRSIAACPLAFGEVGVKERVKNVMDYKKPAFWIVLIAVIVCIAVTVCFLTDPIPDKSEDVAVLNTDSRESAISEVILARYASGRSDGVICVESHVVLGDSVSGGIAGQPKTETVYLLALCQEYSSYAGSLEQTSGSYVPTAVTFHVDSNGEYILQEYWEPRDGSYYDDDIREKFPLLAEMKAFNQQAYVDELEEECLKKAQKIADSGQTLETQIVQLLAQIGSSPAYSSNPYDYVAAHKEEYQELLSYGEHTLRYCFSAFLKGEQNGLTGYLMAIACEDILAGGGEAVIIEDGWSTGQEWFDEFYSLAKSLYTQISPEEMEKQYPGAWLLLSMAQNAH